jgi:hypothetical protein
MNQRRARSQQTENSNTCAAVNQKVSPQGFLVLRVLAAAEGFDGEDGIFEPWPAGSAASANWSVS